MHPAARPASSDDGPASRGLVLLVNPAAGGGSASRVLGAVEARLRERGARFRTHHTSSADDAAVAVRAAQANDEIPVAVGGDGMLRLVAQAAIAGPSPTIGVIPAGRGNDLVRALRLPVDPRDAADALVDGTPWTIDVGLVRPDDGTEHAFLSIASCGFDSEANRIANQAPSRLGSLTYVWGMFGVIARLRIARYALVLDGRAERFDGVTVAVANSGTYGGGMRMAPHASVTDGRFDVVMISTPSGQTGRARLRDRWALLRGLPSVFRGTHVDGPDVQVERVATVRVDADVRFEVYADGDHVGRLPVTMTVAPHALGLLAPPGHRPPSPSVRTSDR